MRHELIATLAWVSAASALAPLVAAVLPRRLLPVVIVEIVLGMLAGTSGFAFVTPNAALELLGLVGFAALMFVSGIEIDLGILARNADSTGGPRRPLLMSVAMVLATFVLSSLGAALIWHGTRPIVELLFLALVLSTTSVAIVVPTLKERALTACAFGQIVLACAILADLLTMLGVSMLGASIAGGDVAKSALPLLFVAVAALVAGLVWHLARSPAFAALFARLDSPTSRLPMRAAFALLFALAWLAQGFGAELVLAAFVAGIAVGAISPRGSALRERIEASGFGFLIPMFFFSVGVGFDLPALLASPQTLAAMPALIALAYANKLVPMLPLARWFAWREVLGGGALLSARLSLVIAAAAIGARLGVIDAALNAAIILLAMFTCIISPALFNLLLPSVFIDGERRTRKSEMKVR